LVSHPELAGGSLRPPQDHASVIEPARIVTVTTTGLRSVRCRRPG
jgi:hypothetical protein